MKKLYTLLILAVLISGVLFAQASGTAVDPPAAKAAETLPAAEVSQITQELGLMLRWFIYFLVLLSIGSLIRIYLVKQRRKKHGKGSAPRGGKASGQEKRHNAQGNDPILSASPKPAFNFTWVFVIIMILFLIYSWSARQQKADRKDYSEFVQDMQAGNIAKVQFTGRDITYTSQQDKRFQTIMPFENAALADTLVARGIKVETVHPAQWGRLIELLLPIALLVFLFMFFMRGMRNQNSQAFSFGRSKAKRHEGNKSSVTFKDVAGVDEAKEELQEIVEFLKDPRKFQRLGGRIPRGVLLVGRPGTGKTLLAKAVSGEAGVPFFSISGSDFVEMFVGVGAARVRDLFDQAKKSSPCIVFIDEIDAVGRHRGTGLGGGHDEREQTLNQLLVEMDGFEPNEAVIIIAATNRPDILDPALLRPGRFDRQVTVDLPDIKGRTQILAVHSAKVPLGENVHLELIARGTPGFSGADLANLVNEAALIAARHGKQSLEMSDFEEAKDKLVLGKEKRSRVIPERDKRMTAYHEIGHVLASVFQDKTEAVHKVSIIPRGFTAGATHFLQTDRTGYSRAYLEQMLVELLGGRAAEEVVFGELTTGAGNDLERVSYIAKKMVCSWGMSEALGPMTVGKEEGDVYLGKELISRSSYSDETARIVDNEIRVFINTAHQRALTIMSDHRELLDKLAEALFDKETLGTEDIFELILQHVDDNHREMVQKKFDKAMELRFEHSSHSDTPEETPAAETKEDQ